MGKIVKYCAACEESFAEKFTFCPNCGKQMTAFEMNPVTGETQTTTQAKTDVESENHFEAETTLSEPIETSPKAEPAVVSGVTTRSNINETNETQAFAGDLDDDVELELFDDSETENFDEADSENEAGKTETFVPLAAAATANGNGNGKSYQTANYDFQSVNDDQADEGYHITVMEEKNVKQRNLLLLGALVIMMVMSVGGVVYSIFNHPLLVGAIDSDSNLFAFVVVDDAPMDVEEPPKKDNDKPGGGGGGGGRDEQTPTSKGRLATQMPDPPLITPTKTIPQKDFDLKMLATTQGKTRIQPTSEQYGDPNSKYNLSSDGMGTGGGQGSGRGTGQGSGIGTGQGSGLGSGSGSGRGDGEGDGDGSGRNARNSQPPPPPSQPVGVTEGIKILAKPKANYTDAARTNQIQGTVRLRVTFTASGAIGSIVPVSGLPYGLTEQAIAAARQIRFEPAKRNGQPVASTKIVEYGFTIY